MCVCVYSCTRRQRRSHDAGHRQRTAHTPATAQPAPSSRHARPLTLHRAAPLRSGEEAPLPSLVALAPASMSPDSTTDESHTVVPVSDRSAAALRYDCWKHRLLPIISSCSGTSQRRVSAVSGCRVRRLRTQASRATHLDTVGDVCGVHVKVPCRCYSLKDGHDARSEWLRLLAVAMSSRLSCRRTHNVVTGTGTGTGSGTGTGTSASTSTSTSTSTHHRGMCVRMDA